MYIKPFFEFKIIIPHFISLKKKKTNIKEKLLDSCVNLYHLVNKCKNEKPNQTNPFTL